MAGRGARLADLIAREASKLVRRHQRYAAELHDELRRRKTRTGVVTPKIVRIPDYWKCARGFDPYKVRIAAPGVAYAIETALLSGTYQPRPAVRYGVPKGPTEQRIVSVFQVADNALSRKVYKSLIAKNAPRLSGRCYAYRSDITIHDAVAYIASEFKSGARIFVAEFDFSAFFESLSHEHFERILTDDGFLITDREAAIVRAFLRAPALPIDGYTERSAEKRARGMPQGTSISLFLANAAASILDRKLERLGIGFVRYADDTLMWSNDYGEVCRAVDAVSETARLMGVELNFDKSDGISILANRRESTEFKSKESINFIGYSISRERVWIKDTKVTEIKRRISYFIYSNLLQPLNNGNVVVQRVAPNIDRDYYLAILQIRRYLYGDLNEARLRTYLGRVAPRRRFHGLMSFYPLIDDDSALAELDGWLYHTISCALRKRSILLRSAGITILPMPHDQPRSFLLGFVSKSATTGVRLDVRLPSFVRISQLLRKAARSHGANAVANPRSAEYYRAP